MVSARLNASINANRKARRPTKAPRKYNTLLPPIDELQKLEKATGPVAIRGIEFELANPSLLDDGWNIKGIYRSLEMESLSFPWIDTFKFALLAQLSEGAPITQKHLQDIKRKGFRVIVGDRVALSEITEVSTKNPLHHRSDRALKMVRYAIYRRGKKVWELEKPIVLYRGDPLFESGPIFEQIVQRVDALRPNQPRLQLWVGRRSIENVSSVLDTLDSAAAQLAIEQNSRSIEEVPDIESAQLQVMRTNVAWVSIGKTLAGWNVDAGARDLLLHKIHWAIDYACATGYFTAKSEVSSLIPDIFLGQQSRQASIRAGRSRGAALKHAADEAWRKLGLKLAIEARIKNRKYGQGRIADFVIEHLRAAGKKPPTHETIVDQIKKWERSGLLQRSLRNRQRDQG